MNRYDEKYYINVAYNFDPSFSLFVRCSNVQFVNITHLVSSLIFQALQQLALIIIIIIRIFLWIQQILI